MAQIDLGKVVGADGISPSVSPNAENTVDVYRLDIETATGNFTTPNLRGPKGDPGSNGVASFNGRTGAVTPNSGDYTAEMVGAATPEQVNTAIQEAILNSWGAGY